MEILIAALESLGNQASLPLQSIDTIRKHLLEADEHCNAQARSIIALQRDVKALQRDNQQARQERDRQQQSRQRMEEHILLGEAAYKLAALIEEYVFEGSDPESLMTPSLKQVSKRRAAGELKDEQARRWDRLLHHLATYGLTERLLVQSDSILRSQRKESAHGSRDQLQKTRISDLRQWADAYIDGRALQPVRQYLEFLNTFSTKNKPLCPDMRIT